MLVAYNRQLGLRTEPAAGDGDGDGETALSAADVSTPWLCLAGAALAFIVKWAFTLLAGRWRCVRLLCVRPSVCPSVCLSVCLFVRLSACLSAQRWLRAAV